MAGVRIATVSTIALTTVGSIIGRGGLGNLIGDALPSFFKAQVLTASVLCVLLAVVADLLLLGLQRLLTPGPEYAPLTQARVRSRAPRRRRSDHGSSRRGLDLAHHRRQLVGGERGGPPAR